MHFYALHKDKRCILVFFDILQPLCDEKGISVSALLDSLGMSRGNMGRWKNGLDPKAGTKKKIAEALGVDRSVFDEKKPATGEGDGLTAKDRRDIARDLEKLMDELENSGDLMFDGDPLTEEATESIRNAMAMALEYAKKVNKEKYTPKKYRKEKGE